MVAVANAVRAASNTCPAGGHRSVASCICILESSREYQLFDPRIEVGDAYRDLELRIAPDFERRGHRSFEKPGRNDL